MAKKKLNIDAISNELEGSSLFFKRPNPPVVQEPPVVKEAVVEVQTPTLKPAEKDRVEKPVKQPRYHDTTVSRYHEDMIEIIRKAVKTLGKEAATYRYTQEEKKALRDIIYTYEGQGLRTSENEIGRIAINYLIEDYHQNGEESVLAKVLAKLNA